MTDWRTRSMNPLYLLAYDIRDPKRLQRVHRFMTRYMYRLQYSVFVGHLSDHGRATVMSGVANRINAHTDDVRLYRLPSNLWADGMGKAALLPGVQPGQHDLGRLMRIAQDSDPDVVGEGSDGTATKIG